MWVNQMTYVMSDIHGDLDRFRSVMDKINLQDTDTLYVLGDVIDGYPYGLDILYELRDMKNVVVLLGNHEKMCYEAMMNINGSKVLPQWLKNGGRVTMNALFRMDTKEIYEIMDFIKKMPLTANVNVNGQDYLLLHSCPPHFYNGKTVSKGAIWEFSVTNRVEIDDVLTDGRIFIFGHTPTECYQDCLPFSIYYGNRKIGINCGSGNRHDVCRLACLRLDDMKEYYSD